MRPLNRITPQLPAAAFKTYQVAAPLPTHWRPATCEEAGCPAYEYGWRTLVDETSELGRRQAHYIRRQSGRKFVEDRDAEGLTVFMFAPGQTCFQPHQVPLEREPLYLVRGGDWRGDPLGGQPYQHRRAEDWVEDFAEHQDRIARQIERG
ncbi:hypothetical protein [Thermoactinospora rubra]|uniref:hypothetical protein n=1 Tax=Thermoactinospora rubra TaxID=1088767 RepID=UPI000A100846|nr:hypothetical protein [Thermoactinospora rubra]